MNFPIIMSLWLMRQRLDDDTDTDMTNASALESAAFALCCIVAAAILCVASACAWDLLSDFYFFLNDSMALLAAYIIGVRRKTPAFRHGDIRHSKLHRKCNFC